MRFGILGVTQAWDAEGSPVALGGPGRRAALALLLLDAGRIVTVQRMIDGLYGEDPPAAVGNALQSHVSRLRRVLRGDLIETHPAGYRLAVDPEQVDVHRFARLAAQGRETLGAGDPAKAAEQLRDALALWRGPALADVQDAPFAGPQAVRLEEQWLGAAEDRVEADLELVGLGRADPRALVPELRELVAAHPLRERLSTQLVRALHGSGQQAEALAAFADAREALADALGADPGPELAAAHLAVLRGPAAHVSRGTLGSGESAGGPGVAPRGTAAHGTLGSGESAGGPGVAPRGTAARGTLGSGESADAGAGPVVEGPAPERLALPGRLSGLIGRGEELERVAAMLREGRLVTLTGPGGTGKTRIAVETAARHPVDSCFADLSGLAEGADLPQVVLTALGLRGSGLRGAHEGPTPLERLTSALAHRDLLLVLDNCEQLVADAARLATDLLAACPGLCILATSREAFAVTGERLFPVPTLPETAAVALFAERATAVRPDFDPRRDAEVVAEICRRLDGLPLAIELAAARLRMLSPRQIADRLDDRFRLLTGGSRTAQPRQQTLRAVVDWSWDLLPEAERAVLRRASVFSGGWTLDAAEAVCGAEPVCGGAADAAAHGDVLELLGALVDKSLVGVQQDEDGEPRYRLLQTVRAYAAEKLAASGEEDRARRAHLRWFTRFATEAGPRLRGADQVHWLRRLAADHDNFHAALGSAEPRAALRLIGELSGYWLLRGLRFEGGPHARAVLCLLPPEPVPGLEEEYAICVILGVLTPGGREALAEHYAVTEALMARLRLSPCRLPAVLLLWAPITGAPADLDDIDLSAAGQWLEDPWHEGLMHIGNGFQAEYVQSDMAAAERHFLAAAEQFGALGDRWGQLMAAGELAVLSRWRGDAVASEAYSAQALRLARELGATEDLADLLSARAELRIDAGELDAAVADCEEAIALYRRVGAVDNVGRPQLLLATVARVRGELRTARELCLGVLEAAPPGWFGGDWQRVGVLLELSRIALAGGDAVTARGYVREAVPVGVDTRNRPALAAAAEVVAEVLRAEGRPEGHGADAVLEAGRVLRGGAGSVEAAVRVLTSAAQGGGG
ncbi:AfsR/SARP family transcriptional regulator [Streptacidiphilus carbonis]|uniref:AfsR/SARP family transcriptional regulator n=1 Tax=Streptacidiphilus carbonis TaxID=105422 RepID=UPI0012698B7B|nr:BTAD domain-containing putative transcriptional regulator [Streptacidiphilus carbonis]